MKIKEKKVANEQVPFDPILFAVTVPSRQPTAQDIKGAKERSDDAVEPKDQKTMGGRGQRYTFNERHIY